MKFRNMLKNNIRLFLLLIVAGLIGYVIGVTRISFAVHSYQPDIKVASKEPPPSLMHGDFSLFWVVLDKLQTMYYDKKAIDPQKMINGAIGGMVASLDDPYTVYLPPKQNDDFKQSMAGKFEGIGAELGMKDKKIVVVSPLDGSPAKAAGIRAGDVIIKVNDVYTSGWDINQTVEKIRGPKGTEVTLNVLHKSDTKPVDIKIVRDTINIKSITTWTKPVTEIDGINKTDLLKQNAGDKVIYIRLSQFGDTADAEWLQITNKVNTQMQKDKSIKGIVFDLRNNPGGYLDDAIYIISEFVKDGVAVMKEDRNGDRTNYPVSGKGLLYDVPVVVLINKGSASASEIVAGSLRDHQRATLVGENSFGKGTVQQAEDLGGGAGIHITIAKWLTPNATWVGNGKDGTGLKPDISVDLDKKDDSHDVQLEKAVEALVK